MNKNQQYSNHKHWVPLYHFLTLGCMGVLLIGSVYYLIEYGKENLLLPFLLIFIVITIISVSFHARSFALKAQDRAIRAEESLRYYMLSGKRLDPRLTLDQIIALRFASDEELISLVETTVKMNLKPDSIKRQIKTWRPDFHRA